MMDKKKAVEIVLEKRFGEKNPEKISCLSEVNTVESADNAENSFGIGVEIILEDKTKEKYQVNNDGIIFSWGNTLVIDDRSLNSKL